MPWPHITAHSGIRCDRLCPLMAELTSFSAIISQSHQYLTELNALAAVGKDGSHACLLLVLRRSDVTQWKKANSY